MPRAPRLEYKDAYYHVMNRGRGRQVIFPGRDYYLAFLETLMEAHDRFGVEIHAYCLMSNHYHLLVKTPNGNLSRSLRHINGLYTQRYNRLKRTDGPLFRGRYKAIVVDRDTYFLSLTRYIHRNPIETRSPLVKNLSDYPWSSYPAYIGKKAPKHWLYKQETFELLGGKEKRYQRYIEANPSDPDVVAFYRAGRIAPVLGSEDFKKRVMGQPWRHMSAAQLKKQLSLASTIESVARLVGDEFEVPAQDLRRSSRGQPNIARQVAVYCCQRYLDVNLREIADYFGMTHKSAVSQQVRRLQERLTRDRDLERRINVLCQHLTP